MDEVRKALDAAIAGLQRVLIDPKVKVDEAIKANEALKSLKRFRVKL